MKKRIVMLLTALALTTVPVKANASVKYELNGNYRIEVLTGVVLDAKGNGAVLYDTVGEIDPNCNYISYYGINGIRPGDVIQTVLILNGENEEPDDILIRQDYVIESFRKENK